MLHPIPDSSERARLLEVVELQKQLIEGLCSLSEGSVVDLAWLKGVWLFVPESWVDRFWNLPSDTSLREKPGKRSVWIATIAAASSSDKRTIINLMEEQLRFSELYQNPPTIRLTNQDWRPPVFAAVNKLLKSFYDPLFYKGEGYTKSDGEFFHKEHFIEGFNPHIKICPYTDNVIQDTKLDHFLPKDRFPMLSCHPDNLIPCSTDANSGSHKGSETPLDIDAPHQALTWFHPRWQSARNTYRLAFSEGSSPQPNVKFIAIESQNQLRLDNMARMFDLGNFWGGFLDDEVQNIASDVQGWLKDDSKQPSEMNVKEYILKCARQARNRIGKDGLSIPKSFFYEYIAETPVLLAQVVRTCVNGT